MHLRPLLQAGLGSELRALPGRTAAVAPHDRPAVGRGCAALGDSRGDRLRAPGDQVDLRAAQGQGSSSKEAVRVNCVFTSPEFSLIATIQVHQHSGDVYNDLHNIYFSNQPRTSLQGCSLYVLTNK